MFTGRRVGDESDIYYVYLREEDDDKSSRDRKLEKALEAMKKRKASDGSKTSESKPDAAKDGKSEDEAKGSENKKDDKSKDTAAKSPMSVDLDKIHERVRRISLPDTFERDLLFSPDGKKLAFAASVGGKSGWYTVEFPDKLEPKLMNSIVLNQSRWPKPPMRYSV